MNKKHKIIFFCMIFVAANAFSQSESLLPLKMLLLEPVAKQSKVSFSLMKSKPTLPSVKPVIAPDFYVTRLGFFCKQEIKMDKATSIPFRFRLGSVEDCDRMEGKQQRYARKL